MSFDKELLYEIEELGAQFFYFADISQLEQNKGFPRAIIVGIPLSSGYLHQVLANLNFIHEMIERKEEDLDEFAILEKKTDLIADKLTSFIIAKGYNAFSQSEQNLASHGLYNHQEHLTPLPHKTIARFAGKGWLGKSNLLITPNYGSAISICSLLTDAPLPIGEQTLLKSSCENCSVCKEVCPTGAIKGINWDSSVSRDEIVDVYQCTMCLKCVAFCPFTRKHIRER